MACLAETSNPLDLQRYVHRLSRGIFLSEVSAGSRQETASNQRSPRFNSITTVKALATKSWQAAVDRSRKPKRSTANNVLFRPAVVNYFCD
jgi:hypothetical protein